MKLLLVVFLVAHVGLCVVKHVWGRPAALSLMRKVAVSVTQLVLFGLAVYVAIGEGVLSRALLSPVYIGLGLLAGHIVFGLSLLFIHRSVEDAASYFLDFGALWRFIVDHPYVMTRFILVGVTEEIVWRAAAQPVVIEGLGRILPGGPEGMLSVVAGIVLVAVGFSLVHDHFFTNSLTVSVEFFIFALSLGVLYHWTGSLILVIIIHTLRDVEICHLEYIVMVDEFGDEQKAAEAIERQYMRPVRSGYE